MALDKATVAHIAHLARIKVDEDELGRLVDELSAIIGWAEQLDEVDTEGVVGHLWEVVWNPQMLPTT